MYCCDSSLEVHKSTADYRYPLRRPKHEIFVAGIVTKIRSVLASDLGTGQKIQKVNVCGLILPFISRKIYFGALSDIAKKYKIAITNQLFEIFGLVPNHLSIQA